MRAIKSIFLHRSRGFPGLAIFFGIFIHVCLLTSCKQNSSERAGSEETDIHQLDQTKSSSEVAQGSGASGEDSTFPDQGNLVEVTSTAMNFEVSEELPSGWTTFRYYNRSPMTHFFVLRSLPVVEGKQKTVQDQYDETAAIFDGALEHIIAGNREKGLALLAELPPWVGDMVSYGGVGMLSPGETGQTDIFLEPGLYQMECYIKTGGTFHTNLGMAKEIRITEEDSGASPPEPTLSMEISTGSGFEISDEVEPGRQVLEVYFKDQVSENGSGHDVNLVRLEEESDLEELGNWMTWTSPEGMETPAPAGTFLGGVQNMRSGETGYMTVDIAPGNYVWISEGSDLSSRNLLKSFKVPPQ